MIKRVYTIFDHKSGYFDPFCDVSDSAAIRGFQYSLSKGTGVMTYAPTDFDLVLIGTFDTESGVYTPCAPQFLTNGGVRNAD